MQEQIKKVWQSLASATPPGVRNEVLDSQGKPREVYAGLLAELERLPRRELRQFDDRLEATLREMGVTFAVERKGLRNRHGWDCDLLPQIFAQAEWMELAEGLIQRLRAFDCLLQDLYGARQILRDGILPVQVALGSPYYEAPAAGLPRPGEAFLHLSGAAVVRRGDGHLAVRHHYFSHASGIGYMMQNRRALTRVMGEFFGDYSIESLVNVPTDILETLRGHAPADDPTVVLLSPGQGSPAYSEHSFLGRRMGIPVVQGSDLLVHRDQVFLKTISGLQRVEVIYTRLADAWLDPLVFRRDSLLGVAGLVQCVRQGSVKVLNCLGSQLADDRALLPYSAEIIKYYLNERMLLPVVKTYWLGEIDQREYVLANLDKFILHPLYGERIVTPPPGEALTPARYRRILEEISPKFSAYVAQEQPVEAETVSFPDGRPTRQRQDHIVFALRQHHGHWEVFPGALTRVTTEESPYVASELQGGSKDTWVERAEAQPISEQVELGRSEGAPPVYFTTSRVAESSYWAGRYLERASGLAGMISTIESLELEELNRTERQLYRPVWNQMLPPLENRSEVTRRTLSSPRGRYFLALDPAESGSVVASVERACSNARSISDVLSVEASVVLAELQAPFLRNRFHPRWPEEKMVPVSRKLSDWVRWKVPQFFGVAATTMVLDGGWKFCLLGQMIERAIITANALRTITQHLTAPGNQPGDQALEIRLSAFLRLLTSRDAYRRIYQSRIEPAPALAMLWEHPTVPRSVRFCLDQCADLLQDPGWANNRAVRKTLHEIESLRATLQHTDWADLVLEASAYLREGSASSAKPGERPELVEHSEKLFAKVLQMHDLVADGFLNHQIYLREEPHPLLRGLES